MNNQPILFIDSGIGGLPYCMDFLNKNPNETVYYLADNRNFPYGNKTKEEIASILINLTEKVSKMFVPKIIVLACNTATISAISSLRQKFPDIPFVGTVPAVKPAAIAAARAGNNGKIGLLGTERTIKEIHNLKLAEEPPEIFGVAAPLLIDFVENNYCFTKNDDSKEKTELVKKYIDIFRREKVDTIVLGCTHFLFLQDEFLREARQLKQAGSDFKIFDSLEGIVKRIEFILDDKNLRAPHSKVKAENRLLLSSGKNLNPLWEKRAKNTGFTLEIIDI